MEHHCKAESGLQLLARLSSRPSLNELNEVLFPSGVNLGDIIEISGDSGSGKTTLITQLLVKCLLPKHWNGFEIGGLGAGAIILNTDHHFHLLKLVNLMEQELMKNREKGACESAKTTSPGRLLDARSIEEIIKVSLTNLVILSCYDSLQFHVTFHSIENILSTNANTSLIIVDSMTAYYWQDAAVGGIRKMDLYLKKILKTLCSCIHDYKVAVMYTKQTNFHSKIILSEDCTSNSGISSAAWKVQLNRIEGKDVDLFFAEISSSVSKRIFRYTIAGEGLQWID